MLQNSGDMVQKEKEKEKEKEKKKKGKGWLSLCCKARHCLLCCNTVATKAAPSYF
jgi:hypothetical protein